MQYICENVGEYCSDLLQGCVLFVNAVAILNNDRFLEKSKSYAHSIADVDTCCHPSPCSTQLDGDTHR